MCSKDNIRIDSPNLALLHAFCYASSADEDLLLLFAINAIQMRCEELEQNTHLDH